MRRRRKSRRKAARTVGKYLNFGTGLKTNAGNLDGRSLKTGFLLTLTGVLYLAAAHQTAWALGFTCGSALSLFSLFSLKATINVLFRPGGIPMKAFFLCLALFIKLPAYCLILDIALNSKNVSQAAVCFGLCLTPLVITLKTIGEALAESLPAASEPVAATFTQRVAKRRKALRLARERG